MQSSEQFDQQLPPMLPSDEATEEQLQLARQQGEALRKALNHMIHEEAHGAVKRAGDYLVAWAAEDAEGMYHFHNGSLEWTEPQDENCHIEVGVMDAADGRFVPGLNVTVTVIDAQSNTVGTHQHEFLWHPWLYHYGRNWTVPGDGDYTLRIRIDPPTFMRHDKRNGRRFEKPVELEFTNVTIETGQKKS